MTRTLLLLAAACFALAAQDEKPAPAPTIPDLIKDGTTQYMRGNYDGARDLYAQAWDLAQQAGREDPIRYDVLKRLCTVRAAVGEFADADNYLQLAISWREQNLGPADPKLVDDVLLSVGYARGAKDYEKALLIMRRVMSLHGRLNVDNVIIADDFSRMAQIDMELKKMDDAVTALQTALSLRTKATSALDPSLVYDLDRLGGIQITQRAYPQAEETYRHALVIRETLYGKQHADLISTVDGLAYAIFGQKRFEDAEPVYKRLLSLWVSSVGSPKHPMVAITLDKIAVFYAAQKKWDEAREATTEANAIRAYLLADGLSVEASQRLDEGKLAEAEAPYKRALLILDPPNPVYDEERADIENMLKELDKVLKKPPAKTSPAPPSTAPAPKKK